MRRREERLDRLPLATLDLLRQVADVGRRGPQADRTVLRRINAGQDPQQRGLAGAVRSDEPGHLLGSDDQIQPGEQRPITVAGTEIFDDESGGHVCRG